MTADSAKKTAPPAAWVVIVAIISIPWSSAFAAHTFNFKGITLSSLFKTWTAAERSALEAALAHLPDPIASQVVKLERYDTPCLTDGIASEDELLDSHTLHLCDAAPADLGRQAVLLVLYALDSSLRWSEREDWRRLSNWRSSLTSVWQLQPDNIGTESYLSTKPEVKFNRASHSPRWELISLAAALFLDEGQGDERVVCQLLSQAEFFRERLSELAPGQNSDPIPNCAAFADWAQLQHLEGVELLLAAPSSAMVGSLFGHLLLRLRYRDAHGDVPLELGRAIAFLADNETPFREDPAYALKGIVGTYAASLHERPFLSSYREYVVSEGRDLRRWRLNLQAEERRKLLERIWTLRQSGRYRYYFFAQNCATLTVDLINSIVPEERKIFIPGLLAAPPSSILERFEAMTAADKTPFAVHIPEPIFAFEHHARLASLRRRETEQRIARYSPPEHVNALNDAFAQVNSEQTELRVLGYNKLASLLINRDMGLAADIYKILHDSSALESHLSALANHTTEEQAYDERRDRLRELSESVFLELDRDAKNLPCEDDEAKTLLVIEQTLADLREEQPSQRLQAYQRLREQLPALNTFAPELVPRVRLFALLQSELHYDVARMKGVSGLREDLLFPEPDKEILAQSYLKPVNETRELLKLPSQTRVSPALLAVQKTKQILMAARELKPSPEELSGAHDAPTPEATAHSYAAALPRSGIDQLAVLSAVDSHLGGLAGNEYKPGIVLAGAIYDERLGDHRRFGFPSHTALVIGRSSMLLSWARDRPQIAAYDARLIGYRSLAPGLPEAGGKVWPLGWEMYLDTRGNQTQALGTAVDAGWSLLTRLWHRDELASHLLLVTGLALQANFPTAVAASFQALGSPIALEFRGGLAAEGYRSYWAGRIFARPLLIINDAISHTALQLGSALEAHLALRDEALGGRHDPALLIALRGYYSSQSFRGQKMETELFLSAGIELR